MARTKVSSIRSEGVADFDLLVSAEVLLVARPDEGDPACEHGGHHLGVVDLLGADV
jgi:hypothetical protein